MSIAENLTKIAENQQKVYDAGKKAENDEFWDKFQKNGTRSGYVYAFAGAGWTDEHLAKIKYPLKSSTDDSANYNGMFYYTTNITQTPVLQFEKCTTANNMFYGCSKLKEVYFEGKIGLSLSFAQSNLLTHDCLIRIISGLKDFSGTTTTRTLTLHSDSKSDLSDAEKAIATEKGWTLA